MCTWGGDTLGKTSFSELYQELGALILASTGRRWWQALGIQGTIKGPYAVIYIESAQGVENEIVETIELEDEDIPESGNPLKQIPWNISLLDIRIEFFRNAENNSALEAATRLKTYLRLQGRFRDIWRICGLVGPVNIIDVSAIAGADIEPRTRLTFSVYANIADPEPLTGQELENITSQGIEVTHVNPVEDELVLEITINEDGS